LKELAGLVSRNAFWENENSGRMVSSPATSWEPGEIAFFFKK
jgi:hypothetical protein